MEEKRKKVKTVETPEECTRFLPRKGHQQRKLQREAKKPGTKCRSPRRDWDKARELWTAGASDQEIARVLGCAKSAVCLWRRKSGLGDMTVNASALLIQAVEEAKNASKARMGRNYCSWHEAWAKLLEQKESAEKEKKALDTLHKELWGAITEKDEDRARMELWQIANNALQMAMCYALLAAEAGRAVDELT